MDKMFEFFFQCMNKNAEYLSQVAFAGVQNGTLIVWICVLSYCYLFLPNSVLEGLRLPLRDVLVFPFIDETFQLSTSFPMRPLPMLSVSARIY